MLWVIAGSGPSLSPEIGEQLRGHNVVAVNDAYKLIPHARALYAADFDWWLAREGCLGFSGEKWSCWSPEWRSRRGVAKAWGLQLFMGSKSKAFSEEPRRITYGRHSGFQAANVALLRGAKTLVLVGFDMRGTHFFGKHEPPLRTKQNFAGWIAAWREACQCLPDGVKVINATPDSALEGMPKMELTEALRAA